MKKLVGVIDATPRWSDLVPTYLFWLKAGTPNERKVAEEELLRLGKIADEMIGREKNVEMGKPNTVDESH